MRAAVKTWTAQETELAQALMADGADDATFIATMGRTKKGAHSHLRRHKDYTFGNILKTGHYAGEGKIEIPPQVLEDRNQRLMARYLMTPAAQIMGDPEPGRTRL